MTLLWCDGFDHYGVTEANMIDGVYAAVGEGNLTTSFVATGTHAMFIAGGNTSGNALRKVLPAAVDKVGVCFRLYFDGLPPSAGGGSIINFCGNSATTPHLTAVVDSVGAIRFLRGRNYFTLNGENGTLIAQSDPVLVASAWNFVEIQAYIHDTDGWVRVAVNGVHRYEATGLDTRTHSTDITGISHNAEINGSSGKDYYMDDLYIYDFNGDSGVDTDFCPTVDGNGKATNYIGELQVIYLPMDGDTAETDWLPSTGSDAYAMVDEVDPSDADYIYSTTAGDLSEFEITDLPEEITYIRGVQLIGRMSKGDSGAAMTTFGMKSDAATDDAPERPVTVEPTYWWDFMNEDPDSGARWTRASLNAAWFRLARTL